MQGHVLRDVVDLVIDDNPHVRVSVVLANLFPTVLTIRHKVEVIDNIAQNLNNECVQRTAEEGDCTPTKSSWERNQGDFGQAQRSKYEKSELSYYQSQLSQPIYDHPSDRQSRTHPHDASQVYNAPIPVRVKSFEREDYHTMLRFQISSKTEKNVSAMEINLTDDRNPKFLWKFVVRETEFMGLKNDQKLKVDYSGFPQMLEDHLSLCQSEKEVHPQDNGSYFHLLFDMKKNGEGVLSILESNKYKESVHLSLLFRMSNDEQIKEYLAAKLIAAKEELEDKQAEISKLQQILNARMTTLETMRVETREETDALRKDLDSIRNEEQKKYNALKERTLAEEERLRKEFDQDKREALKAKDQELQEAKARQAQVQSSWTETKEKLFVLQGKERDLRSRLGLAEKEASSYLSQLQEVKAHAKDLEGKRYASEKTITQLTCKVESLRSELEDKKSIIASHSELKENTSSQIAILADKNKEYKRNIDKTQDKIAELEAEVARLNAASREAAQKYDKKKDKLVERNAIIKDQQKEVNDLKRELEEQRKREGQLAREREDLASQLMERDVKAKNRQAQIEHCQQQMQEMNSLVQFLQRQLNEKSSVRANYYAPSPYQPNYTPPSLLSSHTVPSGASLSPVSSANVSISRVSAAEKRIDPVIKRYNGVSTEEPRDRSKSPLPNRLSQQVDPDQDEKVERGVMDIRPKPIKFKNTKTTFEQ